MWFSGVALGYLAHIRRRGFELDAIMQGGDLCRLLKFSASGKFLISKKHSSFHVYLSPIPSRRVGDIDDFLYYEKEVS